MTNLEQNREVLVVDDEPQILTSIRDLLEDDFTVSTASDAETALHLLEDHEIAVILSDQRMPGVRGDEFLKRAKELSHATRILITGYSDIEALVGAVNNGQIYAYVAKPWDAMQFKFTVLRAAQHYQLAYEANENENRFRSLFEEAPIAYNEIDELGIIRKVNRASCALLGYDANEVVDKFVWDFIAPGARAFVREAMTEKLRGSMPVAPFELEILSKAGMPIPVEMHETLIYGKTGQIAGLRAALLDNRQRKIAERASRKTEQYALELKIKNDELVEALEAARHALTIKSRFLANMSHELRTPLNGVIGLSEVLCDELAGSLSPLQKDYVDDILASGRHLLDLVNNLLDLERVELGKMTFSPEEVDVKMVLTEVRDVLRTVAEENQVTVSVAVDAPLVTVNTDPVRLRQIVYNYLSNAIKFSPPGSAVQVRAASEGNGTFRVEVNDQGPGMSPQQLSSIFADFHQLDRTQKRAGQGAGLGLALTKRIVEAQGGLVGVQSVPGAGSSFYAVLPVGCVSQLSA
jgi:two-component system cell cycle sensor histidine kinase PleC